MHNLLAHVDRRAKCLQRNLHNINGANHPRTEASWLQKQNPLGGCCRVVLAELRGVQSDCRHPFSIPCLARSQHPHSYGSDAATVCPDVVCRACGPRDVLSAGESRVAHISPLRCGIAARRQARLANAPYRRNQGGRNGRSTWSSLSRPRSESSRTSFQQGPYSCKPCAHIL